MSSLGNKEVFASNLSKYLNRIGKSQREMADIMGVSSSTFNEWMKAKKYPRIDKIEFLANYFGCNKSDLIEEAPSKEGLTEGEIAMLQLFRQIPVERQPEALDLLRVALRMQKRP